LQRAFGRQRARIVGKHVRLLLGHEIPVGGGVVVQILGGDHRFQPFPNVSLVESCLCGKLLARQRSRALHGVEQAQPVADVAERHAE
jgi:hypothetical protein